MEGATAAAAAKAAEAAAAAKAAVTARRTALAAKAADHIVLGKSIGLEDRAAKIGGRHLMGAGENWQAAVTDAIGNPTTKFSVALDGVMGNGVAGKVMSAVQKAAANVGTPFDWEMMQLKQAGRLSTVDFWEGGVKLGNPF